MHENNNIEKYIDSKYTILDSVQVEQYELDSMGKVIAVCISEKKGTQKHPVEEAEFVEDWGIKNDAHAGKWHRQVSLLSYDKIEAFRARGAEVEDGAFGENLVVQGFHHFRLEPDFVVEKLFWK